MCDPLEDINELDKVSKEWYSENVVKEYLKDKEHFKRFDLRHYSQLTTEFNPKQTTAMLKKLGIPIPNTKVTIVGGYTGQFASLLRDIGMSMVLY